MPNAWKSLGHINSLAPTVCACDMCSQIGHLLTNHSWLSKKWHIGKDRAS